ncbi:MAG: phosphate/phosphite/phosphonate ABC transporter substrate-binding protein [Methylophaga sp.]|nr:phosphate/phosphite/phosphonate ABC transporter substrate-binding protein [Methylophaga sp.]
MKKLLAVSLLTLSAAWSSHAVADASQCPTTLRFADTGIEGMEEMVRTYGEFQQKLTDILGIDVQFFPVSDRTATVNALQFNQVDMILAGPSEYAVMRARQDVKMMVGIERTEYGSAFVVHADSDIHSLADLKGKRIAMKDPGSTTGHIIPTLMLKEAGLDIDRDVQALLLDSARYEAMVNRDVDAMGSGVRDVAVLRERHPEGDYRVIAESDTMPRDLFVARGGISDECISYVNQQIMANGEMLMESILNPGERRKYIGARFVDDLTEEEYDRITEAYALVGMPLN